MVSPPRTTFSMRACLLGMAFGAACWAAAIFAGWEVWKDWIR